MTVHYSGNLGLAHDTATIQQAMVTLAADERIQFTFAGGGPQRKALQDFCRQNSLNRVDFRPYCSRDQLSNSLAEGHLGLVTQNPATTGSIVPSKVYGIMAAGRPLLYIGSPRATPARIIDRFNCGWYVEAGASDELVDLLTRLAQRPNELREAGARARQAFVDHFDRRLGVDQIISFLGAKHHRVAASA